MHKETRNKSKISAFEKYKQKTGAKDVALVWAKTEVGNW